MKFQRYCYENDICIQRPDCRNFGQNGIRGYVIGEKYVYLSVSGMPNTYCEFSNNENIPLTDDFLNEWAINTTALIRESVGVVINPSLTMQVPSIIRILMNYEDGDMFDTNSQSLCEVKSFPVVSLEKDGNSYYVIVDGEPLYDRGITNERLANDVFNKLSSDIHLYIKKRWPIKDLSRSISGRNIQLEQTLLDKLFFKYVLKYIVQMNRLDTVKTFIHDNTYHNIESGYHIAYKYIVNKDSNTPTRLITKDGNRAYEFLMEFDKKDPSYGIYYGCRGLILNGDQEEQIETMLKEWEVLRPSILTVLNNTFPTMDFTNRFQSTNNANNKTFWPFWIALGIEEDIIDVATRATTIIAKTYIEYFTNNNLLGFSNEQKEKVSIKTYFTNDAYNSILKELDNQNGKGGVKLSKYFKDFIHTGQKYNVFKSVKQYEKCFQFTKLDITECGLFFELLSTKLNIFEKGQIPWSYYTPLFLSKDGEMLTYAKNKVYYKKNYAKSKIDEMKKVAEVEVNKCLKFK